MMLATRRFVEWKASKHIQLCVRKFLVKKSYANELLLKNASIIIQTAWRSFYAFSAYQRVCIGIRSFQSLFRTFTARISYVSSLCKIVKLQSLVRRFIVMKILRREINSTLEMSSLFFRFLLWKRRTHILEDDQTGANRLKVRN